MGQSVSTLYRWRAKGIPLPAGWSWDHAHGRRLRIIPPDPTPDRWQARGVPPPTGAPWDTAADACDTKQRKVDP